MCPACISTLAILVTGAVSSGGVAALVVSKFRAMSGAKRSTRESTASEGTMEDVKDEFLLRHE